MARAGGTGGSPGAGAAHLRAEWGRWWRTEDWSDVHVAHYILNDQYRTWMRFQQRNKAEVQQNIGLLKEQQKFARQSQMMQMNMQRQRHRQGRYGGGGYGGGMGASPVISYRMMQWASLQMRMGQQEFRHQEITPSMLQIGRGQVRSRRHWAAAAWFLALGAVWAGLWWASVTAALVVTLLAVAAFAIAAASAGRSLKPRRPPVPKLLFVPPTAPAHTQLAEPEAEEKPFAIREAGQDPRAAREAVRLALKREKVAIAEVLVPEQTAYGWKVPLVLDASATADQLVGVLRRVATTLRVGQSRVLAQSADPEDAALVTLRILTSDPFTNAAPYPYRPPLSCSILNPVSLGLSLEGEETPVVLAGQHIMLVANTGAGKTSMVQAIAEYVTACRDAVIVDVDPAKRGLKALAPLAAMTARTPEESEKVLESLLERARRRIASMPPTQDMWIPTPEEPAVLVAVEEVPQLSDRGRALMVALLRIGREAMITELIITQDATKEVLGAAIAGVPGVRILMSCRMEDVPLVVGRPDAVSQGWLPHMLVPSPVQGDPADAGRFYAVTPLHRDPVLRYVTPLLPTEAARLTQERIAAGLPTLDPAPVPAPAAQPQPSAPLAPIVQQLLAAFATHSNPESLSVAQIAAHLEAADPQAWGRKSGQTNRDHLAMVGRKIKADLKAVGLTIPSGRLKGVPGQPSGYLLADIQDALS